MMLCTVCLAFLMWTTIMQCVSCWSAEWVDLSSRTSQLQPPRSGHVAFVSKEQVYVFGGYAEQQGATTTTVSAPAMERFPINDLWKWTSKGWSKLTQQPVEQQQFPQQRLASAAATLFDTQPYIFGGWDSQQAGTGGEILQDIVQLLTAADDEEDDDASSASFKTLEMKLDKPTSRHQAVAISPDKIVLHTHRCEGFVWVFQKEAPDSSSEPTLTKQPATGTAPSARGLHVACKLAANNNKLVVFGGASQDGNMSNEVFVLDLDNWQWSQVSFLSTAQAPSPRAASCLVAVDDHTLMLFGGAARTPEGGGLKGMDDLWCLEFDPKDNKCTKASWTRMDCTLAPPGRNAATLSPLSTPGNLPKGLKFTSGDDSTESRYYLLAGGWAPFQETYQDNFVLRVVPTETSTSNNDE
jgi:N-acetylneuraminic acid mutarotase